MITKELLSLYIKMFGDIDHVERIGTPEEKVLAENPDWFLITSSIQDFELIDKGLVSEQYEKSVVEKVKSHSDSEETFEEIKRLRATLLNILNERDT